MFRFRACTLLRCGGLLSRPYTRNSKNPTSRSTASLREFGLRGNRVLALHCCGGVLGLHCLGLGFGGGRLKGEQGFGLALL